MSQELERRDTLRLLARSMSDMCDEVWSVQRETPEDTYLWESLNKAFNALSNACDSAEAEVRRINGRHRKQKSRAEAQAGVCACPPDGGAMCGFCFRRGA